MEKVDYFDGLIEEIIYSLEVIFQKMGKHELAISYANRLAPETSLRHFMQTASILTEATDFRGLKFFESYRGKVRDIFPDLSDEEVEATENYLGRMQAALLEKMGLADEARRR